MPTLLTWGTRTYQLLSPVYTLSLTDSRALAVAARNSSLPELGFSVCNLCSLPGVHLLRIRKTPNYGLKGTFASLWNTLRFECTHPCGHVTIVRCTNGGKKQFGSSRVTFCSSSLKLGCRSRIWRSRAGLAGVLSNRIISPGFSRWSYGFTSLDF